MAKKRPSPPRRPPVKVTSHPHSTARRPAPRAAATKSSARSTVSGPSLKAEPGSISDAATAKLAGMEAVAEAFPFNAAKPSEYGKAAADAAIGQSVEPPHPMVGGSTLTEDERVTKDRRAAIHR